MPHGSTTYEITVSTGSMPDAGTDATVYIELFGDEGANSNEITSTGKLTLDSPGDDHERGSNSVHSVRTKDLGNLSMIVIGHDNSNRKPGWFLNDVTIINQETNQRWVFPCNKWLAADEGDGRTERWLNVA